MEDKKKTKTYTRDFDKCLGGVLSQSRYLAGDVEAARHRGISPAIMTHLRTETATVSTQKKQTKE